jgi:hypothetical protein
MTVEEQAAIEDEMVSEAFRADAIINDVFNTLTLIDHSSEIAASVNNNLVN